MKIKIRNFGNTPKYKLGDKFTTIDNYKAEIIVIYRKANDKISNVNYNNNLKPEDVIRYIIDLDVIDSFFSFKEGFIYALNVVTPTESFVDYLSEGELDKL